jgi:hypothetical protein
MTPNQFRGHLVPQKSPIIGPSRELKDKKSVKGTVKPYSFVHTIGKFKGLACHLPNRSHLTSPICGAMRVH